MRQEAVKPLLLIATFAVCATAEHLPLGPTALLSAVHVGILGICGEAAGRAAGLTPPRSICDRIVTSYLLGWCLIPFFALVAFLSGSIGIEVGIAVAIVGALVSLSRKKPQEASAPVAEPIPFWLYIIAAVFCIIAVAIPFSSFSGTSILREFYGDAIQRFGVIYALSSEVPPRNPFFAGAPLRYYWLWMIPYAGEYKYLCNDLFTVWKCGQTWTALSFPLGLWYLLKNLTSSRKTASIAVLLALIFTSYEVFAHPVLLHKIAGILGVNHALPAHADRMADPDFGIGILQYYSDQLLTEDFWYIPQNSYAIIVTLTAMIALINGKAGTGALILSALVGINTFFAPFAFPAYGITCLALYGWRSGIIAASSLCAGCGIWMVLCGMAAPDVMTPVVAICAAIGLSVSVLHSGRTGTPPSDRMQQFWSVAMLASFACLISLSPLHNSAALALGYSPSILFGVIYLLRLAQKRDSGPPLILFLLVFCTFYALTTFFISFQHVATAPEWLRNAAIRIGREINLFNAYHKSGKMVRVAWAVFGAMGFNELLPHLERAANKRPYLVIVGTACLALSTLTGIFRPFTYRGHIPVAEAEAAAYLNSISSSGTVLIEDFRTSEINELAPVEVFYYSQWSNGNSGLNTLSGTWANQYLPVEMRDMSLERERQVGMFFTSLTKRQRFEFLKKNRISHILTRQRYDFNGIAEPVVTRPGGYLYHVHN